ncbi:Hypothetical protein SCF082_LOCUS38947 [Durusdinium trenchii]|uniref:N-acetyltransferase domain-containing protein n=1 Tax=Durusdinium trenchii TaxID=1381693 RepID=A0ABP0PZ59_9DINO
MQLCTASRIHAQLAASHGQRPTLWLDDDHSSEDEMPLASLICITSSPEFIRHHRTGEATTSGTTRPKSHVGAKEDVQTLTDEVQLVKVIPAVVDLLTPPKERPARPPASPCSHLMRVGSNKTRAPDLQVNAEVITPKHASVKAEVVTPKRASRKGQRVKMEVFTPKRVLRVRREVGVTPSGKRHPLHPLSPNRSCLRGFIPVRACHLKQRERIASLFGDAGWPQPADYATREAIAELLGLPSKAPPKAVTHLAWAARRDGILQREDRLLAAAIVSVYRYRDRRRCGCLEFIVSRARGLGTRLLRLAQRFLKEQNISRLYSGVDLSRPYAMAAHHRWGFRKVTQQAWAEAGLATYNQGDVCYMVLDMDGGADMVTHPES